MAVSGIGALIALAVFLFVPFPAGTGAGRRLVFSVILGGFAGFGAWSLAGIPALVRDLAKMVRGAGQTGQVPGVHHEGPLPKPSPRKKAEVRRIVRAMADHGLFVPEAPDPALLFAGVAEQEWSVKPDSILEALGEVDHFHPGTDPERWMANLIMHNSHAEQDEAQQIADIAMLAGNAIDVRDVVVRRGVVTGAPRATQVDVMMTVDGEATALSWLGDVKYLSTHIHHVLATRLRTGPSGKRLAWLWTDQGAWISVLDVGAVEALNLALKLGPRSRCAWSWVDEAEPMAAGQMAIEQGSDRSRPSP